MIKLIFALALFYLAGCFINWIVFSALSKIKTEYDEDVNYTILDIMLSQHLQETLGKDIAKSWWVTIKLLTKIRFKD